MYFFRSRENFALSQNLQISDSVYQQWFKVPSFEGYYPTIGSWVINGQPAGIGIREDKSPIIKGSSRFIPHCFS